MQQRRVGISDEFRREPSALPSRGKGEKEQYRAQRIRTQTHGYVAGRVQAQRRGTGASAAHGVREAQQPTHRSAEQIPAEPGQRRNDDYHYGRAGIVASSRFRGGSKKERKRLRC